MLDGGGTGRLERHHHPRGGSSGQRVLGRILRAGAKRAADPKRLARAGIGIVVVDTDAPERRDKAHREVRRIDEFGRTASGQPGAELRLYAVDGARESELDDQDRAIMLAAWSVAGLALLIGSVAAARSAIRRRPERPSTIPTVTGMLRAEASRRRILRDTPWVI